MGRVSSRGPDLQHIPNREYWPRYLLFTLAALIPLQLAIGFLFGNTNNLASITNFNSVSDERTWPACKLPGQERELSQNCRVRSVPYQAGFVTFGPYISLPEGGYEVTVTYSTANRDALVGYVDVTKDSGVTELSKTDLTATDNDVRTVSLAFTIEKPVRLVEVRTFTNSESEVEVHQVSIKRLR